MSSEALKSNIIIATKLRVTPEGFKAAHAHITNIKKRLAEIEAKTYVIKVKVDSSDLKTLDNFRIAAEKLGDQQRANAKAAADQAKATNAAAASGRRAGSATGAAAGRGGGGPTGDFEIDPFYRKHGKLVGGGTSTKTKYIRDPETGDIIDENKVHTDTVKYSRRGKFGAVGTQVSSVTTDDKGRLISKTKSENLTEPKPTDSAKQRAEELKAMLSGGRRKLKEELAGVKEAEAAKREAAKAESDRLKAMLSGGRRKLKEELAGVKEAEAAKREAAKAEIDRLKAGLQAGKRQLKEFAKDRRSESRAQEKQDKKVAAAHVEAEADRRFRDESRAKESGLMKDGYRRGSVTRTFDSRTGKAGEVREYYKVARDGLAKYRVELTRVNTAARKTTAETLTGARAAKFLGDSLAHTVEKVMLWTGATSVVFTFLRALKALGQQAMELEANTVFLARVGTNIRGIANEDLSFKEKFAKDLAAAGELTEGIVQLTTVIGGSATEAQQAASVFLRMGQTKEEALKSVTAALVAAKIAELGVGEAADLISSAMLQFGVSVEQIMPTLDSLNTLSNNYKVTTQDLLQSISRAGAVFADHNGRLTELAATTAIVAKRTSRTGTQIGNALKTIQSRLDRIEVRKELSSKLSMSLHDIAGEAKSLSLILLELEHSMDGMNDSQRKDITLRIAGIRQRNILNAAVKDSVEIMIAENRALDAKGEEFDKYGSAMLEGAAASFTMKNSMERLNATFTQIAEHVRGPISEFATVFMNLGVAIMKVDKFLGGWLSRTTLFVGVLAAMNLAKKLMIQLWPVIVTHVNGYAVSIKAAHAGTVGLVTQMRAATSATQACSIAMGGLRAVAGQIALTAALVGIVSLIGYTGDYLSELQGITSLKQSHVDMAQAELSAEEKKLQAIRNTTKAMVALLVLRREAVSSGKSTEKIDSDIDKAVLSAGGSPIDRGNVEGSARISMHKREVKALEDIIAAKKKLLDKSFDIVDSIKSEEKELRLQAEAYDILVIKGRKALSELGITHQTDQQVWNLMTSSDLRPETELAVSKVRAKFESQATSFSGLTDRTHIDPLGIGDVKDYYKASTEHAEVVKRISSEYGKIGAFIKEIEESQGKIADLTDPEEAHKFKLALINVKEILEVEEKRARIRANRDSYESATGLKDMNRGAKEYRENLKQIAKLDAEIASIEGPDRSRANEETKEMAKNLYKMVDATGKLAAVNFSKIFKPQLNYLNQMRKVDDDLVKRYTSSKVEFKHEMAGRPDQTLDLEQMNARRSVLDSFTSNRRLRIQQIEADPSMGKDEKALRLETGRLAIADNLVERAKLESDYAIKLLETENQIVLAKKEAAKEAAKALGLLSEEDKLRVRAQAAFFAANPGKTMRFDEQFAADSTTVGLAQKYFAGRMEEFNPGASPFAGQLTAAGFGQNRELNEAEKFIQNQRGGRNDQQILGAARGSSALLRERAGTSMGENIGGISADLDSFNGAANIANAAASGAAGLPNIDIRAFNIAGMVKGIEGVVNAAIQESEAKFMNEIDKVKSGLTTPRPVRAAG